MINLIKFIKEKILKKNNQKLLMPGSGNDQINIKLDYSKILEYINNVQYSKDLHISFFSIAPRIRKKLINNLNNLNNLDIPNISFLNSDTFLYEGMISGKPFVSLSRKTNEQNRYAQTIISEGKYIDLSTKKDRKSDKDLYMEYQKLTIKNNIIEIYKYSEIKESYYREVKKDGLIFIESASYDNEEKIIEVELSAQPSDIPNETKEYSKITGLSYIANSNKCRISDIIKAAPFVVNICIKKDDGNSNTDNKLEIIKVFKSKKECVVGYKPEIILLFGFDKIIDNNKNIYRLLKDGTYADNNSFKMNFEGKYSIKKLELPEIQNIVGDVPFALSDDAKSILRNGMEMEKYIKNIYDMGVEKIRKIEKN